MLFPYLGGIQNFLRAPVTWLLVLANVGIFFFYFEQSQSVSRQLNHHLDDDFFIQTQGELYKRFLKSPRTIASAEVSHRVYLMGTLALRDQSFLSAVNVIPASADRVAFDYWRRSVQSLLHARRQHPNFFMGLTLHKSGWRQYLLYQFAHSSFQHLIGNMVFLLIFGAVLEQLLGGLGFLMVYLGSGVVAALAFLSMTEPTTAPLVGASGSISGLIALFATLYWNRPVRYFFWVLPRKNYYGFIFLPAIITLFLWMMTDLAGYLSAVGDFGGVAYSAHLGGHFAGFLLGVALLQFSDIRKRMDKGTYVSQGPWAWNRKGFQPFR